MPLAYGPGPGAWIRVEDSRSNCARSTDRVRTGRRFRDSAAAAPQRAAGADWRDHCARRSSGAWKRNPGIIEELTDDFERVVIGGALAHVAGGASRRQPGSAWAEIPSRARSASSSLNTVAIRVPTPDAPYDVVSSPENGVSSHPCRTSCRCPVHNRVHAYRPPAGGGSAHGTQNSIKRRWVALLVAAASGRRRSSLRGVLGAC